MQPASRVERIRRQSWKWIRLWIFCVSSRKSMPLSGDSCATCWTAPLSVTLLWFCRPSGIGVSRVQAGKNIKSEWRTNWSHDFSRVPLPISSRVNFLSISSYTRSYCHRVHVAKISHWCSWWVNVLPSNAVNGLAVCTILSVQTSLDQFSTKLV